jgi:hypothetical protein
MKQRAFKIPHDPETTSDGGENTPHSAAVSDRNELDTPFWSVISFDQVEASGLTYAQAATLVNELSSSGKTGLCLVTDVAGKRMSA